MRENREKAIAWVLEDEGAEVNVSPSEPGGISKYGVSLQTMQEWCRAKSSYPGYPAPTGDDVRALTPERAAQFYGEWFADRIGFDDLPAGIDYMMLNVAVSLGVGGSLTLLSAVMNVWGLLTRTDFSQLMLHADPGSVILNLSVGWIARKSASPSWLTFGHGWVNRKLRAEQRALGMLS